MNLTKLQLWVVKRAREILEANGYEPDVEIPEDAVPSGASIGAWGRERAAQDLYMHIRCLESSKELKRHQEQEQRLVEQRELNVLLKNKDLGDRIWARFVELQGPDTKNLLGSIAKNKKLYDQAVEDVLGCEYPYEYPRISPFA